AQGADHDQIGGADDAVMAHEEADYDYEDHPADAENDTSRRLKTHIKVFKDSSSTQKSTSLRQAYTGSKRIEEQAAPAECLQTERSQKRQLTVELQSATLDDSLELSSESAAAIQSAPKKKRNTRRSEIEPRRVIFNNTLNTVFGEVVVRNNRSLFGSILENVERLWCLVHNDQELHTRHVEVTHLVAILETMKIGYEPKGLPIIPCHAWIRDKMSEIRHIEAIHAEIKNSRVTAALKNFNEVFTRLLKQKEHIDNGFTNLIWQ
ncbi:MAG: hypothetical protein P4L87_14185, partial [Formivibrio sp.]|nr:hypothetical protein [Formivibrio sp.]